MSLKDVIRKFAYGPKTDASSYVAYLRSLGMVIGENTTIYVPTKCQIDTTRPWMIEIGRNVSITEGVTILTYGYDGSVFKGKYGDVLGSAGRHRWTRRPTSTTAGAATRPRLVVGVPPREIFAEFFWLFEPRGKDVFSDPSSEATQRLCGSFDQSQALFECTEPRFASCEEFLSELEKRCRH